MYLQAAEGFWGGVAAAGSDQIGLGARRRGGPLSLWTWNHKYGGDAGTEGQL